MTDYRSRRISGLLVPCDERVEIGPVIEKSIQEWYIAAGMEYFETIRGTPNCKRHDFVMWVDDQGHDKQLPWNPRAQFLSGYPLMSPILGDAIFFSEDWADYGWDTVSLGAPAERWLTDKVRANEFNSWLNISENQPARMTYRLKFPQHN